MMLTKVVLLLLLAAAPAVSARPKSHELEGYNFEQFSSDYNLNYSGAELASRKVMCVSVSLCVAVCLCVCVSVCLYVCFYVSLCLCSRPLYPPYYTTYTRACSKQSWRACRCTMPRI
jgi:hypothetical protein